VKEFDSYMDYVSRVLSMNSRTVDDIDCYIDELGMMTRDLLKAVVPLELELGRGAIEGLTPQLRSRNFWNCEQSLESLFGFRSFTQFGQEIVEGFGDEAFRSGQAHDRREKNRSASSAEGPVYYLEDSEALPDTCGFKFKVRVGGYVTRFHRWKRMPAPPRRDGDSDNGPGSQGGGGSYYPVFRGGTEYRFYDILCRYDASTKSWTKEYRYLPNETIDPRCNPVDNLYLSEKCDAVERNLSFIERLDDDRGEYLSSISNIQGTVIDGLRDELAYDSHHPLTGGEELFSHSSDGDAVRLLRSLEVDLVRFFTTDNSGLSSTMSS
jgi:hypothetical protein